MTRTPFLTPVNLSLAVLLSGATLAGYLLVPEGANLPVHWNIEGELDATLPRNLALAWPAAIAALVWGVFYVIRHFAPPEQAEGGRYAVQVTLSALTGLLFLIQAVTVLIGIGYAVDMVRVVCGGLAGLLLVLGNAMPKSQPNGFAGLRIPSTLSSAENWQATHRFSGRLLMLGGVLLGIATTLNPPGVVLFGTVGVAVLGPVIAGTIYSLRYRRDAVKGT